MTTRRFNEAEVAAIFKEATEAQHAGRHQLPSGEGMTLAELQEIGREVGIAPESIVQAARLIDQSERPTVRTFLRLPLGVERTVDLDRRLSEAEWERLVVDLRETFDARGTVGHEGTLRSWTNGNLHALLEPTATGHRVRFRTVKGDARGLMVGGLAVLAAGAVGLIMAAVRGTGADAGLLSALGVLATMGAAMFGVGALRLPSWARLRQRQMEEVAGRLTLSCDSEPPAKS
ncbi:MAG: hypothetical protein HOP28_01995 [Gemmatimonadales bacterium]|nr:hypothetical protein [Gemmatimonadales bacterium]